MLGTGLAPPASYDSLHAGWAQPLRAAPVRAGAAGWRGVEPASVFESITTAFSLIPRRLVKRGALHPGPRWKIRFIALLSPIAMKGFPGGS